MASESPSHGRGSSGCTGGGGGGGGTVGSRSSGALPVPAAAVLAAAAAAAALGTSANNTAPVAGCCCCWCCFFCWLAYSFAVRARLNGGKFACMRLLAELRTPDGDPSSLVGTLHFLPREPSGIVPDGWIRFAGPADDDAGDADDSATEEPEGSPTGVCGNGDDGNGRDAAKRVRRGSAAVVVRADDDVVCRVSDDGTSYALFGPPEIFAGEENNTAPSSSCSLRELASRHTVRPPRIYEDAATRLRWMRAVDACVRAAPPPSSAASDDGDESTAAAEPRKIGDGAYTF